jgi:CHAD domain-containing protein
MVTDIVKLKETKPALAAYIRESQALLKRSVIPGDDVIHDVRVLMKKSRSVLKLASSQFENGTFSRDIKAFREVGRIMCCWRESAVHRKTLKELKKEFPDLFMKLTENENIMTLLKKPETSVMPSEMGASCLEQIAVILNKAGFRIRFQSMDKIDPKLLLRELEVTYLRVTDTYLRCRNNPRSDKIHEFRKKMKDFLYQLYFFRPLNPSVVKSLEKKLESLTQYLGKYNDLTQVVIKIGYKYPDESNLPALDELIVKIREKQDRYLSKVWPLAYEIFCPGQNLVNVLGFKLLVI